MSVQNSDNSRLDIVAVFAQAPEAGGGFHQSLNSLQVLAQACRGRHRLRAVVLKGDSLQLRELLQLNSPLSDIEWLYVPRSRYDWLVSRFPFRHRGRSRLRRLVRSVLKADKTTFLDGLNADVIYFLSPNSAALHLRTTPFIMTVWDVCHLDFPEFPEVRAGGEFERREALFTRALPQAVLVVTDSEALSDRIHARYGVDRSRLLAQPFLPSPFLFSNATPTGEVLELYDLEPGYWFYPAQFWAHKNHVRILEAFVLLRGRGERHRVVFTGSDKGFRADVEAHARRLGVAEDVRILGFIPSEHLRGIYEGALGLVFPTYFGPTNLPPLEAIALGVPVVCSDFHEQTLGDGPHYFNPDDAEELAAQMLAVVRELRSSRSGTSMQCGVEESATGSPRLAVEKLQSRLEPLAARLTMLRGFSEPT